MTLPPQFKGLPLHEDDVSELVPGRRFFVVLESVDGQLTLRLHRQPPRNRRGQVQLLGLLGAFGDGRFCTVRTALGAVEVGAELEFRTYSPKDLVLEMATLSKEAARA